MLLMSILSILYIRITQAENAGGSMLTGKIKLDFRKILKLTETEVSKSGLRLFHT